MCVAFPYDLASEVAAELAAVVLMTLFLQSLTEKFSGVCPWREKPRQKLQRSLGRVFRFVIFTRIGEE